MASTLEICDDFGEEVWFSWVSRPFSQQIPKAEGGIVSIGKIAREAAY
jgi:hypothetical protein